MPRIIVNSKAYANEENFLDWLEEQLVPILKSQLNLLVLDLFSVHRTQGVLDTFLANNIMASLIPGGPTPLLQPLDIRINPTFKDIIKVGDLPAAFLSLRNKRNKKIDLEDN